MTHRELNQVAQRLGGYVALTDIMLQIVKTVDSPLIRAYQNKGNGIKGMHAFFSDGAGDPPKGFYLYTIEDDNQLPRHYETLKLVYGYYSTE